jgi:hypothetical protein
MSSTASMPHCIWENKEGRRSDVGRLFRSEKFFTFCISVVLDGYTSLAMVLERQLAIGTNLCCYFANH